jgi:hypothetical protein
MAGIRAEEVNRPREEVGAYGLTPGIGGAHARSGAAARKKCVRYAHGATLVLPAVRTHANAWDLDTSPLNYKPGSHFGRSISNRSVVRVYVAPAILPIGRSLSGSILKSSKY